MKILGLYVAWVFGVISIIAGPVIWESLQLGMTPDFESALFLPPLYSSVVIYIAMGVVFLLWRKHIAGNSDFSKGYKYGTGVNSYASFAALILLLEEYALFGLGWATVVFLLPIVWAGLALLLRPVLRDRKTLAGERSKSRAEMPESMDADGSQHRQAKANKTDKRPPSRILKVIRSLAVCGILLGPGAALMQAQLWDYSAIALLLGSVFLLWLSYRKPWCLHTLGLIVLVVGLIGCWCIQIALFLEDTPPLTWFLGATVSGGLIGLWRGSRHRTWRHNDAVIAKPIFAYIAVCLLCYLLSFSLALAASNSAIFRLSVVVNTFFTAVFVFFLVALLFRYTNMDKRASTATAAFAGSFFIAMSLLPNYPAQAQSPSQAPLDPSSWELQDLCRLQPKMTHCNCFLSSTKAGLASNHHAYFDETMRYILTTGDTDVGVVLYLMKKFPNADERTLTEFFKQWSDNLSLAPNRCSNDANAAIADMSNAREGRKKATAAQSLDAFDSTAAPKTSAQPEAFYVPAFDTLRQRTSQLLAELSLQDIVSDLRNSLGGGEGQVAVSANNIFDATTLLAIVLAVISFLGAVIQSFLSPLAKIGPAQPQKKNPAQTQ